MFPLTNEETDSLLLQTARAKTGRGGRQTPPYAFTEHGIAMLSSVLSSERAVQMHILIIRAFVKLRSMLATHRDMAARMDELEAAQKQHTSVIAVVVDEIKRLKTPPPIPAKRRIGFHPPDQQSFKVGKHILAGAELDRSPAIRNAIARSEETQTSELFTSTIKN